MTRVFFDMLCRRACKQLQPVAVYSRGMKTDVVLSRAEYLNELRLAIQQLAIDIHEYSQTLTEHDWRAYEELAGGSEGLADDLRTLLERGSF